MLLGVLYLFLSFWSLRNLFLLVGILTWLSVRVLRGNLEHLSQIFDKKKVVQSTEAQRISRVAWGCMKNLSYSRGLTENFQISISRCISMALFLSRSYKGFTCKKSEISAVCLFWKTHLQGIYVIWDGNIQYANLISRFFGIYYGIINCCDDNRCTEPSWVRKSETFQSDLTPHQGLKLTELLPIQVSAL